VRLETHLHYLLLLLLLLLFLPRQTCSRRQLWLEIGQTRNQAISGDYPVVDERERRKKMMMMKKRKRRRKTMKSLMR